MTNGRDEEFALLSEVFSKVPSAIVILDEHGVVKRANSSAHEMLSQQTLIGRKWYEVIEAAFQPRRDDGQEISTRTGKRLQVLTRPLSHGQLVQMNDLTVTRELQDKISHMERLSSLGQMAASLAHQIRTPLSAAMLYAANLGSSKLPPSARALFQKKLMSRLEALEAQVGDILMYARSGEQTVSKMDAVDLAAAVSQNVQSVITRAGAELITDIGDRPMPILGNSTALSGAVSNLVANAVEAGAKKVKISFKKENGEIAISVANDGPAIPENIRQKICEPFFTTKSNGTGLGLAVATAVARVHHGRLELSSESGFNVVFSLYIPEYTREESPSPSEIAARGNAA